MKKIIIVISLIAMFLIGYCVASTFMVNRMEQFFIEKEPTELDISVELAKEITVLRPSYMTSEELDNFIKGTKLYGIGKYLIEAEEDTGIGADILLAIICHETGKGTNVWSKAPYRNLFSWGVYGGVSRYSFSTYEECILKCSGWIKSLYLTKGGTYYSGETLYAIGEKYASDSLWYRKVENILANIPKSEVILAKEWIIGAKVLQPFNISKGIKEPWNYWQKPLTKEEIAIILYRVNKK